MVPMATDLDAGIVDQRVRGLVEAYGARLAQRGKDDPARRVSNAFCALCVATLLDLDLDEAVATVTDGGEDGGVDAIHIANLRDDQPLITLFQAKYEQKTLAGRSAFPAAEIPKLIETIRTIFDPDKPLSKMRDIEAVVEEVRSRMREGAIPTIRVCCATMAPVGAPTETHASMLRDSRRRRCSGCTSITTDWSRCFARRSRSTPSSISTARPTTRTSAFDGSSWARSRSRPSPS